MKSLNKRRVRCKKQSIGEGRLFLNQNVFNYLKNSLRIAGKFETNQIAFEELQLDLVRYFDSTHYSEIEKGTFLMCLRNGSTTNLFTEPTLIPDKSHAYPSFSFKFVRSDVATDYSL